MASESSATTVWEGSLEQGRGETTTASHILDRVEVSWPRRVERTDDTTSPEELLAAAHAACYCMGLAHEAAEAAAEGCPISGALKGNVEISVEATLES